MDEIYEKWKKTGLLDGLEVNVGKTVSYLLENQEKQEVKSKLISLISENQRNMDDKLTNLAIQVFKKLKIWDWVSVQPMLNPVAITYYKGFDEHDIKSLEIVACTRRLKYTISDNRDVDYSQEIAHEIECEVLDDLLNNVRVVSVVNLSNFNDNEKTSALRENISGLISVVRRNSGISDVFLVVNDKLYEGHRRAFKDLDVGVSIYQHSGVPGVLCGCGKNMESGYVYAPYIPFTYTPLIDEGKRGLLTRYGKRLLPGGSSRYGKLTVLEEEKQ